MESKMSELEKKVVVNLLDGEILGMPKDIVIDTETTCIKSIVVQKKGWFGVGRPMETTILWEDITLIGKDAILIQVPDDKIHISSKKGFFEKIFS